MNNELMRDENFIRCSTMVAELLMKYKSKEIQHLQDQGRMGRKDSIHGISPIAVYQGEIETEFPVPLRTSITAAQS